MTFTVRAPNAEQESWARGLDFNAGPKFDHHRYCFRFSSVAPKGKFIAWSTVQAPLFVNCLRTALYLSLSISGSSNNFPSSGQYRNALA